MTRAPVSPGWVLGLVIRGQETDGLGRGAGVGRCAPGRSLSGLALLEIESMKTAGLKQKLPLSSKRSIKIKFSIFDDDKAGAEAAPEKKEQAGSEFACVWSLQSSTLRPPCYTCFLMLTRTDPSAHFRKQQ